jgi:hypothetical protein
MLLAQQKLCMLKALEEQSLQASALPIIQSPVVDSDDEEPPRAAPTSSADLPSTECIRLKFMSKTKQQVGTLFWVCFFSLSQPKNAAAGC